MIKQYTVGWMFLLSLFAQAGEPATTKSSSTIEDSPQVASNLAIENNPSFQFLSGELAIARQNIPEAVRYFDQLIKQEKNPFVLERRINLYFAEKKGKESLAVAEQLVKENPDNINALITLAMIHLERDDEPSAINTLHGVTLLIEAQNTKDEQKNVHDPYIYIYQGLGDKEKPDRLIRILEGLIKLNPKAQSALNLTAGLLIDEGDADKALVLLDQAQALNPEHALTYTLKAYAYSDKNDVEKAVSLLKSAHEQYQSLDISLEYLKVLVADFQYDNAIKIGLLLNKEYPHDLRVWERLALLYYSLGEYKEAQRAVEQIVRNRGNAKDVILSLFKISTETETYQEVLDIIPPNSDLDVARLVMINKGHLALKNKKYSEFLAIFDGLRARFSEHQFYLYLEQLNILEEHKESKLLLDLASFLEGVNPEDFTIAFFKSMGYHGLKDYANMEKIFTDWLVKMPDDARALNGLGYMIIETDEKRVDEGLKLIEKAHEKAPKDSAILDSLGWAYFKKGDIENADKYLAQAYNKMKQPEVIAHYILLLDKQGKRAKAKEIHKMLSKIYPKSIELEKLNQQLKW